MSNHARVGFSSYINLAGAETGLAVCHGRRRSRSPLRVHPGQALVENENGTGTVTFSACGLHEMCWHLYSSGDKVEVLGPASLRKMVEGYRRSDFKALP